MSTETQKSCGISKKHIKFKICDSGLRRLKFVGLIEDVRSALDKEVDVFDKTHIIPNSKIPSEISKDGVVIYEI